MVITVYSDRRSGEIGDIAHRLAEALSALVAPAHVVLLDPQHRENVAGANVSYSRLDERATPADVESLLASVHGHAVAIFALSGPPTEQVIAAFDASERVLLLGDPSVSSMRGIQRTLKLCQSLGYEPGRATVVLHDFGDDAPLAPDDAALALKREIFWSLPGPSTSPDELAGAYYGLAARLLDTRAR